jgi:LCP family protein required for cell wall assembly
MAKHKARRRRVSQDEKVKKHRRKKWLYWSVVLMEIIVLAALSVVAYGVYTVSGVEQTTLDIVDLEAYQDTGDYTNIALFGLDSREGELEGGVQSDCIMIASINNSTYEVNLVSVYRDTLLLQSDGTYEKANSAYNMGGPAEAIALLNRNFDLDIEKYISVNFNALADVIDALGGIELELTEEEVYWTNYYCVETAQVVGRETTELEGEGMHLLDGVQAVSFARIRYTSGDDFKRTHRQRLVLEKVAEKAQEADFLTLNQIVNAVFPQISTNLTTKNLLGMAANITKYQLGEMSGFPFEVTACDEVIDHEGSYVAPVGLAQNVIELHKFLFNDSAYEPSENVQNISDNIIYLTGIDPNIYEDILDVSYSTEEGTDSSMEDNAVDITGDDIADSMGDDIAGDDIVDSMGDDIAGDSTEY